MSEQIPEVQQDKADNSGKINMEMLIAFCAVLISIASFYATFLQANAAEKQVTAMTLPLMNFMHGNVQDQTKASVISYTIANKGVGPAKVEAFLFTYKNKFYNDYRDYFSACCEAEWKQYLNEKKANGLLNLPLLITNNVQQQIITSGEELHFIELTKHPVSEPLWQALDKVRNQTHVTACYCSLLDNCYWLTSNNQITDTPSCKE